MNALGIDIGSSSIKGAVLDLAAAKVRTPVSRPFPAPLSGLPQGWIEIDPLAVCRTTDQVLSILHAEAPDADMLFVSGQMAGLILLDQHATPLTNYISWRDQRTLDKTDAPLTLLERFRECWQATGCWVDVGRELHPGSTAALLGWLQSQGRLPGGAKPATIGDFIIARLAGHPIPTHVTQSIGMLDLRRDAWHLPALAQIGLQDLTLPELALAEECVGTFVIGGQTIRLFGSYGDQQCALRGAGLQADELSLNISTGSQVSRRTDRFQPGPYQSRKYFFGDILDTVSHLPAGRSLNVLVDLLTELARFEGVSLKNPWATINQLIATVSDTDLQVDPAFFPGPMGERGRIGNISTDNLSVGTLFHATFRSMAENYAHIAERFAPCSWKSVVLSGGLTQYAPRLRDMLKDRFAAPFRESAGEETLTGLLDIALSVVSSATTASPARIEGTP